MEKITWHQNFTPTTKETIYSFAIRESDEYGFTREEIWGYNDIQKGDTVEYAGQEWTVVMVSRLGDFGLSQTGALPYTTRVCPSKVRKK